MPYTELSAVDDYATHDAGDLTISVEFRYLHTLTVYEIVYQHCFYEYQALLEIGRFIIISVRLRSLPSTEDAGGFWGATDVEFMGRSVKDVLRRLLVNCGLALHNWTYRPTRVRLWPEATVATICLAWLVSAPC